MVELTESKRKIEALTGLPCTTFTVPAGLYDDGLLQEAFRAGYEYVLTSKRGLAVHGEQVLNRNVLFRENCIHGFADVVHGPVLELLETARRARTLLRASR